MLDDTLTVLITGFVYVAIAGLLAAIVLVNIYAILHAGGGIATAVYLFIHHDEPMPRSASSRGYARA